MKTGRRGRKRTFTFTGTGRILRRRPPVNLPLRLRVRCLFL